MHAIQFNKLFLIFYHLKVLLHMHFNAGAGGDEEKQQKHRI